MQSFNCFRFSHHSISTLSLDLISLVTAIISTKPLISTAQTPANNPDITMTTTPDMSESFTAATVSDEATISDDLTSSTVDTAAEDVHNTSNILVSTVLPRLLSAASQVLSKSFIEAIFCWTKVYFVGNWHLLFRTSDDFVHGFQSKGAFIITCALIACI